MRVSELSSAPPRIRLTASASRSFTSSTSASTRPGRFGRGSSAPTSTRRTSTTTITPRGPATITTSRRPTTSMASPSCRASGSVRSFRVNPAKALTVLAGLGLALSGGAWLVSCGPAPFPDEALINSVRILATRADHPFAKPGETVTLTVLATDQRPPSPNQEPMVIYWLPDPLTGKLFCENPANDAYYGCFTPSDAGADGSARPDGGPPDAALRDAGSSDAGSDGGGPSPCAIPVPGVDLTPCLPP